MRPSRILEENRSAIRDAAARHLVLNPRVFGSAVHGTDTESSDLDLLVDPLQSATLFDLGELQMELEQILHVRVEVLTPADLPASFRQNVLNEAQSI